MKLDNQTPFEAGHYVVQNAAGKDLLVMVVKATYRFDHSGELTRAEEQLPVEPADQYYGDPETTGIRYSSDIGYGKTGTDIAMIGHAVAQTEKAGKTYVILNVGTISKRVLVFGERYWKSIFGLMVKSSPRPFDRIPLVYERAFGGMDLSHKNEENHEYESRNPIGVGFVAKKSDKPISREPLPNIEDPAQLIKSPKDRPQPAGFGFISSHWQPRLAYAGTYDDDWQKNRMPLLPEDFDVKYHQAAHPDLVYPGFLNGDEQVLAAGVSGRGPYRFNLPGIVIKCSVEITGEKTIHSAMHIDKLLIDADARQAVIVWQATLDVHDNLYSIETIRCESEKILQNLPNDPAVK